MLVSVLSYGVIVLRYNGMRARGLAVSYGVEKLYIHKIIELFAKENSHIGVWPLYLNLASLQDQPLAASSWLNTIFDNC